MVVRSTTIMVSVNCAAQYGMVVPFSDIMVSVYCATQYRKVVRTTTIWSLFIVPHSNGRLWDLQPSLYLFIMPCMMGCHFPGLWPNFKNQIICHIFFTILIQLEMGFVPKCGLRIGLTQSISEQAWNCDRHNPVTINRDHIWSLFIVTG